MSNPKVRSNRRLGASRGELAIACGLLVALAGVVGPAGGKWTPQQKADQIVSATTSLERACFRHYADVRSTAIEFSGHDASVENYHELTHSLGHPRWTGPYIDEPLSSADNPCGGEVFLYGDLKGGVASPAGGFDPTRSGRDTVTDKGQFVAFTQVPEDVARLVEKSIDGNLDEFSWTTTGRCEYDARSQSLMVLLLQL